MNIRFILVPLLILAGFLAACSSAGQQHGEVNSNTSESIMAVGDAGGTADNTVPRTHFMSITSTVIPPKAERVLADNSKVTTTNDDAGTKIETRVFGKDSALNLIIVRTTRDGQKSVELHYNDAPSKSVPGGAANLALSESASEIESRLGLKPAVNTNSKPNTEKPVEPVRQMPRDEKNVPATKNETPAIRPEKVVAVPQLPPVNYK